MEQRTADSRQQVELIAREPSAYDPSQRHAHPAAPPVATKRPAPEDRSRKTKPISGSGGRSRSGTPNPRSGRGQALRRAEACKTNPIYRRPGRLTKGIVQNEAKLGGNGACGQRRLPCGAWLGWGVKRAKRTQFYPSAREWARAARAARPRRRAVVRNEANSPEPGRRRCGWRGHRELSCRTKPIGRGANGC
jgi:hypothetical protein